MTAVLVVCLTVLVLWWRIEPLVRERAATVRAREQAIASVVEAVVDIIERRFPAGAPVSLEAVAAELPHDLRLLAERESEDWATALMKGEMAQLYAQATGTPEERWNRVRRSYEMSEVTT